MATIREILAAADKDINTLKPHFENRYLRTLLDSAFIPEKKFDLPEGTPPYKENTLGDAQLAGAFWQIARKLDIFHARKGLSPADRKKVAIRTEGNFINALESLTKEDAAVLLAVKDQKLNTIYPKITKASLKKIGYLK